MTRAHGAPTAAGLALPLALALVLPACGSVDRDRADRDGADPPDTATVSAEVTKALAADGRADVVVSLTPPAGYDDGGGGDAAMRAEIARLQDDVLAALDPADFQLRHRFAAIPALAGTVLTERAVRVLDGHPRVVRVDLDVGGGGGGTP